MLTDFTRFVIVPEPDGPPSWEYRATVTCTECDWAAEAVLRVHAVQSLHCEQCGNVERSYLGMPDEFVGVPCPMCAGGRSHLERETSVLGRIETLRLFCPACGWQL